MRWKREEAGLTLQQLVEGSFYGPSHLSKIERGTRRIPAELADHVDKVPHGPVLTVTAPAWTSFVMSLK